MANKMAGTLGLYILSKVFGLAVSTKCYYYISSYSYRSSSYCYQECCNYDTYDPCCSYNYNYDYSNSYYDYWAYYYTISAGAIAGIVIGCIVALCIFITIIICVCNASRRNNARYGGQVITATQPTVSYVGSTNATNMQPHSYPYGGNINGGFTMGPTAAAPYMANSAPPPSYNNVVNNPGYAATPNQQSPYPTQPVTASNQQSPYPTQPVTASNQQSSYPTQPATASSTTDYASLTPNTDDHYYSSLSDSHSPSAPDSNPTM